MNAKQKPWRETVSIIERLNHNIAFIRYDWATYLALFSDSDNNEVLTRAANPFFGSLRFVLRPYVVLSLARLFDGNIPTQENLTLSALVEAIKDTANPAFVVLIEQRLKEAQVEAEPIRQERHKRIAHLDLETAFNQHILWDTTEDQISSLLTTVESIANQVYLELEGGTHHHHVYADMANLHVRELVDKLRTTDL